MADANLNENLNIVSESGLDIQLLDGDLNIIQNLDDEPNDVGGMTSAELKATFDKAGNIIKDYLNNQLVPAILAADATEAARAEAEAARQSAETGREQAEAERVAAEEDRASAEAARSVWEDYNADKAYVPGNKVAYEGSSYLNISACAGIEPTNTDYWLLIARKGDPGTGDGGGDYLPTSGGSLYGALYFRTGEDMLHAAKLQGAYASVNDNSEDDSDWGELPDDRQMLRLSKLLYIACTAGECGLNLNGGRICKVGDPTYTMDVANKRYVDGQKYTLPIAGPSQLGGVQPAAKTDAMTQAVGVDDAGALWTAPGGKDGLGVPAPTAEDAGKVPVVNEDGSGYELGDVIKPPTTAAVGQTIVVKAVDADGKPTEWEAADMPSGGGGGGESDVFYAIYGTTTNAEILAAYEAGKAVYMKKDGDKGVYTLITIAGDSFAYFACVIYSGYFKRYMCSADNWRQDESVLLAETPVSTTVTLSASGWDSSAKTQTVTVSGVLADETKQLITPTPAASSQAAYYNAGIRCTGQSANELTFTAETVPTEDLTIYVTIQEVSVS